MLTMSGDSSGSNRFARFASDDHATTAQRPLLTLTYSLGNPAVPSVNPGPAPAAIRNAAAALAGNVGNAPGGSQWSLVSGPGDATFGDASLPATTVTFSQPGAYVLRLAATNTHGESSRTLAVNVAPNPARFHRLADANLARRLRSGNHAADQDPDRDNISNLMEWALNLSATVPGTLPTEPSQNRRGPRIHLHPPQNRSRRSHLPSRVVGHT